MRDGLGRASEVYQGALGDTSFIMAAFAYSPALLRSYFARRYGDATSYGYDGAGRLATLGATPTFHHGLLGWIASPPR